MTGLSSPDNESKSAIGGGVAGVSLGTTLIALSPYITKDPAITQFLQMLSPTITVLGAYISKIFFLQIYMLYNERLSKKIKVAIYEGLMQPGITPTHYDNLIKQREEVELTVLKEMRGRLFNNEITPSSFSGNSFNVTR